MEQGIGKRRQIKGQVAKTMIKSRTLLNKPVGRCILGGIIKRRKLKIGKLCYNSGILADPDLLISYFLNRTISQDKIQRIML